jgi:cobalt transporter subunit CbtB
MGSQNSSSVSLPAVQGARAGAALQAMAAMVLGLIVIGTVGFSHIDAIHSAAHDVRHSAAFPCH